MIELPPQLLIDLITNLIESSPSQKTDNSQNSTVVGQLKLLVENIGQYYLDSFK